MSADHDIRTLSPTRAGRPCTLPVLILAGGKGTRLGEITRACPKPMLPVAGKPFVEHVVNYLQAQGIRRFIFLTGYLGEQFEAHFAPLQTNDTRFEFIQERGPLLGTGGAVVSAVLSMKLQTPFLVMNADSFLPFQAGRLEQLTKDHEGSILAVRVDDGTRYGSLQVTADGLLKGFLEKQASTGPAIVNAGIYCLTPGLFSGLHSNQNYSMEKDLFPLWIGKGNRFAVGETDGSFLDIGTPETLKKAEDFVRTALT